MKYFILLFFCLFNCVQQTRAMETVELHSKWQFHQAGDIHWLPAIVPGTVHTDLQNNHLIPDPFYGDNEKLVQWVDTCTWEYRCVFNCTSAFLSHQEIELDFEGLDTYAHMFLNDSLILKADNMFRSWKIPCKSILKSGENELRIIFLPAKSTGQRLASQLPYTLPDAERVFTRKAAYQYGWDWGPRLITCGVWKPVKLVAWDSFRFLDIQVDQKTLNDTFVVLGIHMQIQSNVSGNFFVKLINKNTNQVLYNTSEIHAGLDHIEFNYKFYNPVRWWCHGSGEPYLYHFLIEGSDEQTKSRDSNTVSIGLRTIELVQKQDSIGKSFTFYLNKVPVFMKGANYIPMDNFIPRVSRNSVDSLLHDVVSSNMNMLRIWGGGAYESDYFYSQCDKLGLLIWQDFMFAGTMIPGDSSFIKNVEAEINEQVIRLRNHPCIALWCGNNEINEAWHNWGWQKQFHYSEQDSLKIWNDYMHLFQRLIPDILSKQNAERFYLESSPVIGWGHKESLQQGDSHYWGVWWGLEPFETYKKKVGRFMSEYGFQGMPAPSTIRSFLAPADQQLNSPAIKIHQKHPTGFQTISEYMNLDFSVPKSFSRYIYYSQIEQARGVRMAIEAHRRAKPYCMGTLYWQLNDCWPAISWSSRDYFGAWKALQYEVKEAYKTILLSAVIEGKMLKVYVVSDSMQDVQADMDIKLMDFDGRVLLAQKGNMDILANRSSVIYSADTTSLLRNADPAKLVFEARVSIAGNEMDDCLFYFRKTSELKLQDPDASIKFDESISAFRIQSKRLLKNIWIEIEGNDQLANNYFDVLPGREYLVPVPEKMALKKIGSIIYQTLNHRE